VLGIAFILLVAFWTVFLVALPYLYMVVEVPPEAAADAAWRSDDTRP